jgi:hypothetical protein
MAIRHAMISGATDQNGKCSFAFKIPGTFPGFATGFSSSASSWSGRQIISVHCWFGSGANGDYVTNICIKDLDSILQNESMPNLNVAFPNYPLLQSREDLQLDASNQGLFLMPGDKTELMVLGVKNIVNIPSGMYLCADFIAVSNRSDTIFCSVYWDDLA